MSNSKVSFPVISSLTTLAFDGRRSNYFKKELINALKIIEEGHIMPNEMKGSWAGAMGQCQFMPSSFLNSFAKIFKSLESIKGEDGRIHHISLKFNQMDSYFLLTKFIT